MKVRELKADEIRTVYETLMVKDFPEDELKPLAMIEKLRREGKYRCLCFSDDAGALVAYAFLVSAAPMKEKRQAMLMDYFAVLKAYRGMGVGSQFLNYLKGELHGKSSCLLFEVEDPMACDTEEERRIRERRIRFYKGNRLKDTGVRTLCFGVPFLILAMDTGGRIPEKAEAREEILEIYRGILPEELFAANIKVAPV